MNLALKVRVNERLAQLAKLSEASAGKVERDHSGKPQSKPPPGARENPGDQRPSPDDDLLGWFVDRLSRATSDPEISALCVHAEILYAKRVHRPPAEKRAGAFDVASEVSKEERDRRIRENPDYLDLAAQEVGIIETERGGYCSAANVRRVRMARDLPGGPLHPETGRPKALFLDLTKPERRAEVQKLRLAHGATQRKVAMKLGVSKALIVEYWEGDENGEQAA